MRRSIYDLVAAEAAGEPLSPTDAKRLSRYRHDGVRRTLAVLDAFGPGLKAAQTATLGFDAAVFRDWVLHDLETKNAAALRDIVRALLMMIEFDASFFAAMSGEGRRANQRQRKGGRNSASARRQAAEAILLAIKDRQARNPALTLTTAVRSYLKDTDPEWLRDSDIERQRKVAAYERRLRRARKKTGHKLS